MINMVIIMSKYIRMNNNEEHLSLGNLFRIIKDMAKNKNDALQSDLFCLLFGVRSVNDTTINNYCVGCRSIGEKYKSIFLEKVHNYGKDSKVFTKEIIEILSIIDGKDYSSSKEQIDFINSSNSAYELGKKLYTLANNDKSVDEKFANALGYKVKSHNIYSALCDAFVYIVLKKKQPIYEQSLKKEVIETVLNDTNINSSFLEEYLSLKLKEGINYDYNLRKIADSGNPYAAFELGQKEYYGSYKGYPRYHEAFKYLDEAAALDHAESNYLIGKMFVQGLIGSKSDDDLERGYEYLKRAYNLHSVCAANYIGNMYRDGIHPLKKDETMAISYYKKASRFEYSYALNNLGKIIEKDNPKKAFDYYMRSAELGNSWANNRLGEYYRIKNKDLITAYQYYNRAIEVNHRETCYYAYYNLAKYYLMHGYGDIPKDETKALEYLEAASQNNLFEADVELFFYYLSRFIDKKDNSAKEKIFNYKRKIESSSRYDDDIRKKIENNIKKVKEKKEINLDF